jgi:ADP-ribosyl-[dinitrogen reductase] hydrolase
MTLDPGIVARARGAWLGQIAGDALGTTVEFKPPGRIAELYPDRLTKIIGGGPFSVKPGQVTDDTELALALARSLVERGTYDPDHVAGAYVAWYESGPFDVGGTTAMAFGGRPRRGPGLAARIARKASRTSQANGSVMRLSPLAVWGWRLDEDDLLALAAFDARLSHPNEVCQAANAIFAHAVALAVREGTSAQQTYERTLALARRHPRCRPLSTLLEDAAREAPADFVKNMGWVRIALQNAFHQLLHAPSLEEGVVRTVMLGGDTDTNGCIAGALLGAVHGEEAVPAQWREAIEGCRTMRGAAYQAADARDLALRLVEAGAAVKDVPEDLERFLVVDALDDDDDDEEEDEELEGDDEGDDDDDDPDDTWDLRPDEAEPEPPEEKDETRHAQGGFGDAGPLFGG